MAGGGVDGDSDEAGLYSGSVVERGGGVGVLSGCLGLGRGCASS